MKLPLILVALLMSANGAYANPVCAELFSGNSRSHGILGSYHGAEWQLKYNAENLNTAVNAVNESTVDLPQELREVLMGTVLFQDKDATARLSQSTDPQVVTALARLAVNKTLFKESDRLGPQLRDSSRMILQQLGQRNDALSFSVLKRVVRNELGSSSPNMKNELLVEAVQALRGRTEPDIKHLAAEVLASEHAKFDMRVVGAAAQALRTFSWKETRAQMTSKRHFRFQINPNFDKGVRSQLASLASSSRLPSYVRDDLRILDEPPFYQRDLSSLPWTQDSFPPIEGIDNE